MKKKEQKAQKKCVIKQKLKFKDDKNCLEVNQHVKEIIHLVRNKLNTDNTQENH